MPWSFTWQTSSFDFDFKFWKWFILYKVVRFPLCMEGSFANIFNFANRLACLHAFCCLLLPSGSCASSVVPRELSLVTALAQSFSTSMVAITMALLLWNLPAPVEAGKLSESCCVTAQLVVYQIPWTICMALSHSAESSVCLRRELKSGSFVCVQAHSVLINHYNSLSVCHRPSCRRTLWVLWGSYGM